MFRKLVYLVSIRVLQAKDCNKILDSQILTMIAELNRHPRIRIVLVVEKKQQYVMKHAGVEIIHADDFITKKKFDIDLLLK